MVSDMNDANTMDTQIKNASKQLMKGEHYAQLQ